MFCRVIRLFNEGGGGSRETSRIKKGREATHKKNWSGKSKKLTAPAKLPTKEKKRELGGSKVILKGKSNVREGSRKITRKSSIDVGEFKR